MTAAEKVDAYFKKQVQWEEGLRKLRKSVLDHGFTEEVKWGMPTYTMDGKNLIGLNGFKHHFGIWFFQGVFLSDPLKVLQNAQEGKTKGMRHMKFTSIDQVDLQAITPYLKETIQNHKDGKQVKVERKTKKMEMPELLAEALEKSGKSEFEKMSASKQNEYKEYISSAKREATKLSRLDKIIPMILEGKGLNDKYKYFQGI